MKYAISRFEPFYSPSKGRWVPGINPVDLEVTLEQLIRALTHYSVIPETPWVCSRDFEKCMCTLGSYHATRVPSAMTHITTADLDRGKPHTSATSHPTASRCPGRSCHCPSIGGSPAHAIGASKRRVPRATHRATRGLRTAGAPRRDLPLPMP